MLTHDEVVWGYRYVLGRDPESEKVIERQALCHADWPQFRAALYQVSDGHDFPWHIDELIPGEAAMVQNVFVRFEDAV